MMKAVFVLSLIAANSAYAKEIAENHYLGIGGGYNPSGSQAVLELNTLWFQKLVQNSAASSSSVLFASGNEMECRDINIVDESFSFEEKLFAGFFGSRNANCQYRHNRIPDLDGPASRQDTADQLNIASTSNLKRFRFYFTGHGSPDDSSEHAKYESNVMDLWNRDSMNVQEFVSILDGFKPEAQIQVVMVQCFSGGFSQMNFVGGKMGGDLSSADRCGFFSQVKDRVASGCTPDVKIREEYSPYFFAALSGQSEKGETVNADFDKNGTVSSNEAHAYVIINENAVDIPITTSSQLLRDLGLKLELQDQLESLNDISKRFSPDEKAVWTGLTRLLKMNIRVSEAPHRKIVGAIEKIKLPYEAAKNAQEQAQGYLDSVWSIIRNDMLGRYPTIEATYAAINGKRRLASIQSIRSAFQFMKNHPVFEQFSDAVKASEAADKAVDKWEKRKVKLERLLYLIETKLLEKKLADAKNELWSKRYADLKACEAASFFHDLNRVSTSEPIVQNP